MSDERYLLRRKSVSCFLWLVAIALVFRLNESLAAKPLKASSTKDFTNLLNVASTYENVRSTRWAFSSYYSNPWASSYYYQYWYDYYRYYYSGAINHATAAFSDNPYGYAIPGSCNFVNMPNMRARKAKQSLKTQMKSWLKDWMCGTEDSTSSSHLQGGKGDSSSTTHGYYVFAPLTYQQQGNFSVNHLTLASSPNQVLKLIARTYTIIREWVDRLASVAFTLKHYFTMLLTAESNFVDLEKAAASLIDKNLTLSDAPLLLSKLVQALKKSASFDQDTSEPSKKKAGEISRENFQFYLISAQDEDLLPIPYYEAFGFNVSTRQNRQEIAEAINSKYYDWILTNRKSGKLKATNTLIMFVSTASVPICADCNKSDKSQEIQAKYEQEPEQYSGPQIPAGMLPPISSYWYLSPQEARTGWVQATVPYPSVGTNPVVPFGVPQHYTLYTSVDGNRIGGGSASSAEGTFCQIVPISMG